MNVQFIDLFCGENRTKTLAARDSANAVKNLTGCTISWSIANPPNDPRNMAPLVTKAGTIISAPAGTFSVALAPDDTSGLRPGAYFHQATITDGSGNVSVVCQGQLTLRSLIGDLA